jgi:hypothetical protein
MGIMAHYITDAEGNLIKVAGNFGGIKTKTLWTNPNPTSEFTPQTITLTDENLNIYSTIQIVYYNANYGNRYITTEIKPDGNTYEMSGVHSTGNTVFVYYRGVKASSNYIEFGDCWRGSNSGEVKTNTANIPVLIVGIKKMPDATYIGTELFAGNGIKIDNGEISSETEFKILHTGSAMTSAGTYTLNDSIDNYKMLIFVGAYKVSSTYYYCTETVTVDQYKKFSSGYEFLVRSGENHWVSLIYNGKPSTIQITYVADAFISTVYGVK